MEMSKKWGRMVGEFLVIVIGVLVALGVDEWREALSDQALEQEYLARLRGDLDRGRMMLDTIYLQHTGAVRNADFVLPFLLGEAGPPGDTATMLAALYRASRNLAPDFAMKYPRTTHSELQSTGRLGLIRDPNLRAAVLDYYTEIDGTGPLMDLLPREYRDFVRRRLPAGFQLAVRTECPVFATGAGGSLECDLPLEGYDPRPLLREIQGDQELAGDLNFSRQQLEIGIVQLRSVIERTDSLSRMLREAMR